MISQSMVYGQIYLCRRWGVDGDKYVYNYDYEDEVTFDDDEGGGGDGEVMGMVDGANAEEDAMEDGVEEKEEQTRVKSGVMGMDKAPTQWNLLSLLKITMFRRNLPLTPVQTSHSTPPAT